MRTIVLILLLALGLNAKFLHYVKVGNEKVAKVYKSGNHYSVTVLNKKGVMRYPVLIKQYIRELKDLTEEQKETLEYVYRKCLPYGLGNTCVAIAWEESYFGYYLMVPRTGDYGIMGINLYWYIKDNKLRLSHYQKLRLITILATNRDFNINYAIGKIEYWHKKWNGDWIKTWGSYNGGTKPNYSYANRIYNRILAFKLWLSR